MPLAYMLMRHCLTASSELVNPSALVSGSIPKHEPSKTLTLQPFISVQNWTMLVTIKVQFLFIQFWVVKIQFLLPKDSRNGGFTHGLSLHQYPDYSRLISPIPSCLLATTHHGRSRSFLRDLSKIIMGFRKNHHIRWWNPQSSSISDTKPSYSLMKSFFLLWLDYQTATFLMVKSSVVSWSIHEVSWLSQ